MGSFEGWALPQTIRREEGIPRRELESVGGSHSDTGFYSFFFLLYSLRTTDGRPYNGASRRRPIPINLQKPQTLNKMKSSAVPTDEVVLRTNEVGDVVT